MEWIVTILVFLVVIAITALLFGGWLIVTIVRLIGRLLLESRRARSEPASSKITRDAMSATRCANDRCRAESPAVAAFCRRCGRPMRPTQHVPVRRVAMW